MCFKIDNSRKYAGIFLPAFVLLILAVALSACLPGKSLRLPAGTGENEFWFQLSGDVDYKQAAVLKMGDTTLPMIGFVRSNAAEKRLRVVGMSELGIKFFDLEAGKSEDIVHFLAPAFERIPGFVRRALNAGKRLFWGPDAQSFFVAGRPEDLNRDFFMLPRSGNWQCSFFDFRIINGTRVPLRMEYRSRGLLGFVLSIENSEVETE